jgi:hypothetical protein
MSKDQFQNFSATFGLEDGCASIMLDMQDEVVRQHTVNAIVIPSQMIADCLKVGGKRFSIWNTLIGKTKLEVMLTCDDPTEMRWVIKLQSADGRKTQGISMGKVNIDDLVGLKPNIEGIGYRGLLVKSYPHYFMTAHVDEGWIADLQLLHEDTSAFRSHRQPEIYIPRERIDACLEGKVGETVTWNRRLVKTGTQIVGKLKLTTDSTVLLTVKIRSSYQDSKLAEGILMVQLPVEVLSGFKDIAEHCVPIGYEAFATVRDAVRQGGWEATFVRDAVANRLKQVEIFSKCGNEALRNKYSELLTVMDLFFENAAAGTAQKAIESIDEFFTGCLTLNDELAEKVLIENKRIAADKTRKQGAITTIEDMQKEKERQRLRREARPTVQLTKPSEQRAAGAPTGDDAASNDRGQLKADSAETRSREDDGHETEDRTEVTTTTDETVSPARSARAERIYKSHEDGTLILPTTSKAPKPTETKAAAPVLSLMDKLRLCQTQVVDAEAAPAPEAAAAVEPAQAE